jgi:hypothetical protein
MKTMELLPVAFYGTILVALLVLVQTVVRISQTFLHISQTLEDIALSLRRKNSL